MLGIDMDQNMLEREITRNLGLDSIIAEEKAKFIIESVYGELIDYKEPTEEENIQK